ncbi:endopeptidase La [Clostridium tertium]|jgi:ATP-dependent Lon protease|uniref:endopeptidase La n=1 Tax=Clostridium TaxID=1485 RepID=UPI00019B0713|nr:MULTISPECIES: endopeptidase La [Clostridium]EEH99078.1 ATP-dependent protease La [Clostridium sp. 7_2_43FAA]MDB1921414.1 endopeptidase La [Clostridium tertium]MDB1924659.1 endopeptidase La [Clostridium tertium]MDB1928188.1 endopeptidase La [Clostridium tertium]MDB1947393.1 endopeptidase La [Clostridium tertium]
MSEKLMALPLIPLRGISIFPNMIIHFDVGREKSKAAIEAAMEKQTDIFLATQKDYEIEDPEIGDIYDIGTICKVKQIIKLPNDVIRVLVEGLDRGEIKELDSSEEYLKVSVERIEEPSNEEYENIEAYINSLRKSFSKYIKASGNIRNNVISIFDTIENYSELVDVVASYVIVDEDKKQEILQEINCINRIEKLLVILENEIDIINVEKKIGRKLKESVDKSQREYYIREQIRVLQEEIGEDDEDKKEISKYEERIKKAKLPKHVREKAESELSRLKSASGQGSESNVIRSYLDWILDIPWSKSTKDAFDVKEAEKILDNEHYGLEEVKERIVEYLAVKQYTNSLKGPILCLVGPPGVGKTSIAKSIANATNRKYTRMSLGGVRDEAEIRGHRKTYVGAIPGRLAYALKEAKVNNPLILLDEIDKLGSDNRGNVADALLEVLDSEQNNTFRDHYLELDMDLSKVLFITTANSLDTIPLPLLDRMEIIEVSGYTYEEKYHIAKDYLIPKLLKDHKLTKDQFKISESAIKEIINSYTREAGVRSLERVLGKLIRKSLTEMIKNDKKSISISSNRIEKYLGNKIYSFDIKEKEDRVGVVKGMAWTAAGGDTLPVESVTMKGTGKLVLTGQLGDVMQESAKIAFGFVRANAVKYGIDEEFYKNTDIHIHFPEGSIKKDGPSAGVTIITSIISALTNKKVRSNVAMTGEVTLTGRVLAIGGLKEKSIAAYRAGIDTIIIPKENEKDTIKIPNTVKNKLNIITVDHVNEVLNKAIIGVDTID